MRTSGMTGWSVSSWQCVTTAGLCSFLIALAGCNTAMTMVNNSANTEDGNVGTPTGSVPGVTSGEPNGAFTNAITATIKQDGTAKLQGTVSARGDLDVFLLGPMLAGDRVVVDIMTPGSNLDVAFAIFDGQERLTFTNDDRTFSNFDAFGDFTARHNSDRYFLVVSNSAFASPGEETGSYMVDIQFTRGGPVPPTAPQTLLLNFDGGTVESAALGTMTIDPFDAARIDPIYSADTQMLRTLIRETIQQNYERFNVTVFDSADPNAPSTDGSSTVFLGGFNAIAFGVSEQVDLYNVDFCDDAIIFTESFQLSAFTFVPTTAELAVAIGNVASHEAGHLLGLNHVDDDLAIMDDRSAADAFIEDQEFKEAPLSTDIMRIGTQDAALLLTETVGPAG